MQIAIVGLAGSGKTTVFNTLTRGHAETGGSGGVTLNVGTPTVADRAPGAVRGISESLHDAPTNAARVRSVLDGAKGAARDIVVLNTGAALVVAGVSGDLRAGIATAAAAIDSGAARSRLAELQAFRG